MPEGIVIETEGQDAVVRYIRHSACKKCGACQLGRSEQQEQVVRAQNNVGARVSDLVRIEMSGGSIVTAAMWAYALPLAAFIMGLLIGTALRLSEPVTAVLGLGFLALSYLLTRYAVEPWLSKGQKYRLVIAEIIERGRVDDDGHK